MAKTTFDEAMQYADQYLEETQGISWNDLPDTNSLSDYLKEDMKLEDMKSMVIKACEERIHNDLMLLFIERGLMIT